MSQHKESEGIFMPPYDRCHDDTGSILVLHSDDPTLIPVSLRCSIPPKPVGAPSPGPLCDNRPGPGTCMNSNGPLCTKAERKLKPTHYCKRFYAQLLHSLPPLSIHRCTDSDSTLPFLSSLSFRRLPSFFFISKQLQASQWLLLCQL